jgi:hypothetical protein
MKHFNQNPDIYRLALRKAFVAAPAVSVVRTLAASACMSKCSVRCTLTLSRRTLRLKVIPWGPLHPAAFQAHRHAAAKERHVRICDANSLKELKWIGTLADQGRFRIDAILMRKYNSLHSYFDS